MTPQPVQQPDEGPITDEMRRRLDRLDALRAEVASRPRFVWPSPIQIMITLIILLAVAASAGGVGFTLGQGVERQKAVSRNAGHWRVGSDGGRSFVYGIPAKTRRRQSYAEPTILPDAAAK